MFALSRLSRLKQQADFKSVFAKPQRVTYQYLVALYRPNPLSQARLGMIVKKQLIKSAVKRNLIKRIVRESFRHYQADMKGLDIVVLLRSEYSSLFQLDKAALRNDVDNLWQRLIYTFMSPAKRC